MERKNPRDTIYQSKKILGQLYDMVERADFVPQYNNAPDERILNAYELEDDMLKEALDLKDAYDASIRRVMAQHGIRTEFEVWSTFVLDHNQERKDYKFHEELGNISGAIKDQYRERCIKKAGGRDFAKLGPFVAAMYTVTVQELKEAIEECKQKREVNGIQIPLRIMDAKYMPFISFPWLFHSELGKIAVGSSARPPKSKVSIRDSDEGMAVKLRQKLRLKQLDNTEDERAIRDELEIGETVTHRGDLLELFDDATFKSPEEIWIDVDRAQTERNTNSATNLSHQPSIREETLLDGPAIDYAEAVYGVSDNNNIGFSSVSSDQVKALHQGEPLNVDAESVARADAATRARRKTLARNLLINVGDNDDDDDFGLKDENEGDVNADDGQTKKQDVEAKMSPFLTVQTSISTPSTSEPHSGSIVSFGASGGSKISSLDGEAVAAALTTAKVECEKAVDRNGGPDAECGQYHLQVREDKGKEKGDDDDDDDDDDRGVEKEEHDKEEEKENMKDGEAEEEKEEEQKDKRDKKEEKEEEKDKIGEFDGADEGEEEAEERQSNVDK